MVWHCLQIFCSDKWGLLFESKLTLINVVTISHKACPNIISNFVITILNRKTYTVSHIASFSYIVQRDHVWLCLLTSVCFQPQQVFTWGKKEEAVLYSLLKSGAQTVWLINLHTPAVCKIDTSFSHDKSTLVKDWFEAIFLLVNSSGCLQAFFLYPILTTVYRIGAGRLTSIYWTPILRSCHITFLYIVLVINNGFRDFTYLATVQPLRTTSLNNRL